MNFLELFKTSWRSIWQGKTVWFFSILWSLSIVVTNVLTHNPYLGICVAIPIILVSLFGYLGILQTLILHSDKRVSIIYVWYVLRPRIIHLIGLLIILIAPIIAIVIALDMSREYIIYKVAIHPAVYFLIEQLLYYLVTICLEIVFIGSIQDTLSVFSSPRHGILVFTNNFGRILLIATIMTLTRALLSEIALWVTGLSISILQEDKLLIEGFRPVLSISSYSMHEWVVFLIQFITIPLFPAITVSAYQQFIREIQYPDLVHQKVSRESSSTLGERE